MDGIEVIPLYDASDELTELMAKGHVDRAAMLAAANEGWGRWPGPFAIEDVEHGYRRAVPDRTGDKRCYYHPAERGARGAFPVTTIDAWAPYHRRIKTPAPQTKEPTP